MNIYHYVYRITNTVENKHYYGKRSSKILPHLDLGVKYFSSSKDKQFIQDQKEHPEHYRYKVIKIFDTVEKALLMEHKLHYKFNVGKNPKFYNLAKQTLNGFDTTGMVLTENNKKQISETMKLRVKNGDVFTPEHRANLSKGSKGKPKSKEAIQKTIETKTKLGIGMGKNHPLSKYIYITPWGEFDSPKALEPYFTMSKMKNFCVKCDKKVLPRVYRDCPQLQELFDSTCIGKTYRELGFYTRASRS